MLPTFDADRRRARLGRRHHLAQPADDLLAVARDLCGLHSSDAASVMLAVRARVAGVQVADVEQALYDDRSLARILAMRRTMFVVPTEHVALFHAASTRGQVPAQRRVNLRYVTGADVVPAGADPAGWLADVGDRTVAALAARGEAVATEIAQDVPELSIQIPVAQDKPYGGTIGLSTRVLFLLATEGRIVRGRPRGSWLSTQYRWATMTDWFGGRVDVDALDEDGARATLVDRYLRTFGPATLDDVVWWTGWTKTATRRALTAAGVQDVVLDGAPGLAATGDDLDDAPPDRDRHWVALLPALDPTVMGWRHRDVYLDPALRPVLFDRNGNAGPTVWVDGRVVGGWAQRPDGEVAVRLLLDVGRERSRMVEAEAATLTAWLAGTRVTPRFRTPLERDLSA